MTRINHQPLIIRLNHEHFKEFLKCFFTIVFKTTAPSKTWINAGKHFVYRYHVAKELAKELKNESVEKIFTDDKKLALRLKFYGIDTSSGADLRLANLDLKDNYGNIAVYKFGVKIANFKIIKDD